MREQFVRDIQDSLILGKLNRLACPTTQLALYVLIRDRRQFVDVIPAAAQALPEFCRLFRSTPEGERQCHDCRSRVAVSAYARGLSEFRCHGGISVVAAPAMRADGTFSDRLVVASCMVMRKANARGWRTASAHASGMGIDMQRLKAAYFALPAFADDQFATVKSVIDLAATILGEMETRSPNTGTAGATGAVGPTANDEVSGLFAATLTRTKSRSIRSAEAASGSALVDLIVATVKRDPTGSYSVAHFARAARVTPNHLSAVFHKQTGKTFREFLTGERMACACRLLGDPRLSVSNVARQSGFDDPAYFSRWFRHITGQSPSEWRNGAAAPD